MCDDCNEGPVLDGNIIRIKKCHETSGSSSSSCNPCKKKKKKCSSSSSSSSCKQPCYPDYLPYPYPKSSADSIPIGFKAIITPVTALTPSCVQFNMKRKNGVITLQWEQFSGVIAVNGASHVTINQSLCNLPPYRITKPYFLSLNGENRVSYIQVDPSSTGDQISFFFHISGSGSGITTSDSFVIYGGVIDWIENSCAC